MSISRLASSIAPSPTLALNEEARLMRERGEQVINLGIGEPKNKTPNNALLSAAAHLIEADIKYTSSNGTPSLKKAIIQYTAENYQREALPQNIIVSNGAKQSLFNTLFSLLNPNDEVILLAPYWVSYPEMVRMCSGIPVIVYPPEGSFLPQIQDIKSALNSQTKAIIINSPNNPSGAVFPADLLAQIVELCESKSIFLIADDIYHKLVFDGKTASPAYAFSNKSIEESNIIIVNGVSKLFGMTGIRLGWAVANRRLTELMTNVQSQMTSCVSSVTQAAAVGALSGDLAIVDNMKLFFENNRDIVYNALSTINGVNTIKPEGTFYILPDLRAYNADLISLAKFLLKNALVVTVPGKSFGLEGFLRLSYAGPTNEMITAIDRIKWALDPNAPPEIFMGDRRKVRDWL